MSTPERSSAGGVFTQLEVADGQVAQHVGQIDDSRQCRTRAGIATAVSSLNSASTWLVMALNSSGAYSGTLPVPRTAMALRFLEPITAPRPVRAAKRPWSLAMPASLT